MKIIVLFLALVLTLVPLSNSFETQKTEQERIKDELLEKLFQKLVYSQLNDLNGKVLMQSMMEAALSGDQDTYTIDTKCFTCKTAINYINKQESWEEESKEAIEAIAEYLCAVQYEWFPQTVCQGCIEEMAPYVYDSLWQHYVNADFVCPAVNLCPPVYQAVDIDTIVEDILKDNPEKVQLTPSEENIIRFVHFSDPHTADNYSTDYVAQCEDPACCIPSAGIAESEDQKGGYWGTLGNCDLPTRTYEQMINFIDSKLDFDVDFMIWTGDNTGHNVWDQSFDANLENTRQQTEIIKKIMPNMQVYPIQGNHESYPVNVYEFGNEEKFNNFFAEQWGDWIGEDASEQIKQNGFYETTAFDGKLKIIALNTQAALSENFTLLYNPTDPGKQLDILRASLQQSEDNKQPVYIIAHIPSSNYTRPFVRIFQALMDRYSNTIRSIFTGHTHADQYELFYAQDGVTPVVPNFLAPSTTSYGGRKPSFRVVEIDSETYQVINIRQYRLDIEYWNQFTDPNTELLFEEAYDFLSEYNLENLWDLKNLDKLRDQIHNNLDVFNKYNYNFSSGTAAPQDTINVNKSCGIYPGQKEIQECEGKTYQPDIIEILAGPWIEKISKN